QTVQPLIAKNQNQLCVECADGLGEVHADLTKVKQTLFNLLSNASKITERGTIRLRVTRAREPEHDSLRMDGSASGLGMTSGQLGGLVQDYSQADSSTFKKFGGTGLGLAISKRFCQMMAGDITVTSELGKGSTFTVRLPCDQKGDAKRE